MILTCPECNTRYHVAEGEIGEQGRFVRCSACSHEWLALASQDEAEHKTLPAKDDNILPDARTAIPVQNKASFYDLTIVKYGLPIAAIVAMLFFIIVAIFHYQPLIVQELPFTEAWYEGLDFYKNDGLKLMLEPARLCR